MNWDDCRLTECQRAPSGGSVQDLISNPLRNCQNLRPIGQTSHMSRNLEASDQLQMDVCGELLISPESAIRHTQDAQTYQSLIAYLDFRLKQIQKSSEG